MYVAKAVFLLGDNGAVRTTMPGTTLPEMYGPSYLPIFIFQWRLQFRSMLYQVPGTRYLVCVINGIFSISPTRYTACTIPTVHRCSSIFSNSLARFSRPRMMISLSEESEPRSSASKGDVLSIRLSNPHSTTYTKHTLL